MKEFQRNIVVIGGSRGLGYSIVQGLARPGDNFIIASRTPPPLEGNANGVIYTWLSCDLSDPSAIDSFSKSLDNIAIDVLIYNAGIWEKEEFEKVPREELISIVQVNFTSVLMVMQGLIKNLRKGKLKKIIFIGSTCGLENEGSYSVIYNATKFGLRGITHTLREYLRKDSISVSCISPGSIASDTGFDEGPQKALEKHESGRIPVEDIIAIIRVIIDSSPATCIKEIHVPAMKDTDI